MKYLGNVNMLGNKIKSMSLENKAEFPATPGIGSLEMIQKRLMLCIDVGNDVQNPLPLWMPMSSEVQMYKHHQTTNSTSWLVEHDLNNSTPVVSVYDVNGAIVTPNEILIVDGNTLSVTFNAAAQGIVVVLSGTLFGSPAVSAALTENFVAATSWHLAHNLGRVPAVRVYVNGAEVQASVSATTTEVTVDFGGNSVAGTLVLI